ncbi:fibronectin type III domain-containing protein [Paenibacillus sp. S-38]|uniref:RCC1 domain-containing protein n=1 Tax=Paenibacillus sp. S-38 TaxID=3416710 RepID=UPI003CFBBCD3
MTSKPSNRKNLLIASSLLLASQSLGTAGAAGTDTPGSSSPTASGSTTVTASTYSSVTSATYGADITAPTAPASLTSTAVTAGSVTLSWSAASDNVKVTGYDIYQGSTKVASVPDTSYTVTGLAPNTAYSFTVKARDAAGNASPASKSLSVTTPAIAALTAGELLFEAELLTQRDSGDATTQYSDTAASGGKWEYYNSNAVADYIEYDLNVPQAGTYAITGLVRSANNRSIVQLSVDGKAQGSPVDAYGTAAAYEQKSFGSITFAAGGTKKFRFTVTGRNAASTDYKIALDAIKLTPQGTADNVAPTAPSGLTSTGKTDTTVSLSWTAATDNVGVTGYDIYSGATKLATVTGTTHTVTGLTPATAYSFTVKALDAAGNASPASSPLAVTTNAASSTSLTFEAESAPQADSGDATTLTADAAASGGQWESYNANAVGDYVEYALNVSAAGSYEVRVAGKAGANAGTAALTIDGTAQGTPIDFYKPAAQSAITEYNRGPVYFNTPGFKIFRFTVTGKNASSTGYTVPLDAVKLVKVADSKAPSVPANVTVTGKTSTSVSLAWDASTDDVKVAGYDIYNGTAKVGSSTEPSFTVTGLSPNTTYSFTVKAKDAAGNVSEASAAVSAVTSAALGSVPLAVSLLGNHTLFIKSDGTVWGWGYNGHGQLGTGTSNSTAVPGKAINLTGMKMIAGGENHTIALRSDGTLHAWGYNGYGQLGDDSTTTRYSPVQVSTQTNWTAVSAGENHSLALKSDGTVWSFGYNGYGQLGDGTTTSQRTPVQVKDLTGVVAIAAGKDFSLALKNDGTVWSWGQNSYGELGNGTTTRSSVPVQVALLTDVKSISAGDYHGVALKKDGSVLAWGYNGNGELGNASTISQTTPVQSGVTGVKSIAAGPYHTLALKSDGTVWSWGYNGYGQLGNGNNTNRSVPAAIPGLSSVASIAAGENQSIAYGNDGILYSWGRNANGQLGNGTTVDTNVPHKVIGPNINPADTTAPAAISDLRVSSQNVRSLTLNWSRTTDDVEVASYEIYNGSVLVATTGPTNTSHTLSNLALNTTYQITIRAKDATGNKAAASNVASATTSDKTPPAAPKDVTLTGLTAATATLSWSASTDNDLVKQYNIYQGTTKVGSTASTSFTVTGLTSKTAYSFTVKAEDDAGNESTASTALSATTE